jgi:hypothetical protein
MAFTVAGIGLAVGAAGSVASGAMTSSAAKSAAGQQSAAIGQAVNFDQGVFNTAQTNLQPFIGGGQSALGSLLGLYGLPGGNAGGANQAYQNFTQTPYYQFPLQQGNLALNRQLASSGLTNSGAALKDAVQYNQGYASQGFGQYISGLSGLSQQGQQAATSLSQIGTNVGQQMLTGQTGIGNATAAGTIGSNNALTQGFQNATPFLTGTPNSSSANGGLIGAISNQFGTLGGASSYTGPSGASLIGGSGTPGALQGSLGLGASQFVP